MRRMAAFVGVALLFSFAAAADRPANLDADAVRAIIAEKTARLGAASERLAPSTSSTSDEEFVAIPGSAEVTIDCDAGESVNTVLGRVLSRYLTIHLSGTCRESVRIERPGVTLSGTLAGGAVIDPPSGPAIRALWAHELRLVDLSLTGGSDGLLALASRELEFERIQAVDNAGYGVFLKSSTADIYDSVLSRNETPVLAFDQSTVQLIRTVMEDNSFDGPAAALSSHMGIFGGTMMRNGYGPNGFDQVSIWVRDAVIEFPGTTAPSGVWRTGDLQIGRSEIHTNVHAWNASVAELFSVEIGTDAQRPWLVGAYHSHLDIWESAPGGVLIPNRIKANVWLEDFSNAGIVMGEPLRGDMFLFGFSDVKMFTNTAMDGTVFCNDRSRALCTPHPPGGTPGCE